MANYKDAPWFASTHTTAAGVALEFTGTTDHSSLDSTQTGYGTLPRTYRLRGFAVSGSTAVAISTDPIKILYGDSSGATLTTAELCQEPGIGMVGISGLVGIEGGYIALETTVAHADGGLTFSMWGD